MLVYIFIATLGLAIGSFINALVWRLHAKEARVNIKNKKVDWDIVNGRSACIKCGHTLSPMDLIPVISWVELKGKCRYCNEPIHWQYPVVEIATMIMFLVSFMILPKDTTLLNADLVLWLTSLTILIALFVYDIKWLILPNKLTFPLILIGVLMFIVNQSSNQTPLSQDLSGLIKSATFSFGLYAALFYASRGKWIGGGDVKLALYPALIFSPLLSFVSILLPFYIGALFFTPQLVLKKLNKKSRVPFGPFIILSIIIVHLYSTKITDLLYQMFSLPLM